VYGARAVQKEIVNAGRNKDVRVYFVWMPMLPTDNQSEAARMERSVASSQARYFYDPRRRVGIGFVEDRFQEETREALARLPKEHPFRKRLARIASSPAGETPLWDAVMFFAPGTEWMAKSPRPDWWAKQIGFSGEGQPGRATGQFLRNQIQDGPVESDWFAEAREGLRAMTKHFFP